MDEVRANIIGIVTLNDDILTRLLSRLEALGVGNVSDLIDVDLNDIILDSQHPDGILMPIQARRLVRIWAAETGTTPLATSTSDQSRTTPRNSAQQTPSQTPTTGFSPATPLNSIDTNVSNWHLRFDVDTCLADMMMANQTLKTQNSAKHLKEGRPLTVQARNELVRFITDNILKQCKVPLRSSLNIVSENIVNKYPQLKDEIEGCIVGAGYISFRNQLENRILYLKRPVSAHKIKRLSQRQTTDEVEPTDTEPTNPKRQLRDGYGCVNYLPSIMPTGETTESLTMKQRQLQDIHCSQSWNSTEVTALMGITYINQRLDLVGANILSVPDMKAEWPFLFEPQWFFQHLEILLGVKVLTKMEDNLVAKKSSLVSYLKVKASTHRELRKRMTEIDIEKDPVVSVILLLMTFFKEDEQVLFRGYEVLPNATEIRSSDILASPMLLYEGNEFHRSSRMRIVVNRETVVVAETPMTAMALLFGAYFVFNLQYPNEAGATLEFIQRVLLGINPTVGTKINKSKGRKVRSGVHEAVLALVRDIAVVDAFD